MKDPTAPLPASSASFTWSNARLLGFEPMDHVHEEFYEVVQRLLFSDEESVLAALEEFEAHAVAHFSAEDEWMRSTAFPPRNCHMDEHAAVLKSTHEVKKLVLGGKAGVELVHNFALHLFEWFPGHADHLDSALSAWMCKLHHGGKPVVIRRGLELR